MSENLKFSYTNRDYESSRQEGISKIPQMSKGDWTDTNSTDPGVIILDHVHALVDMMQYYMDHNALESFITTAKERKNIFRLAEQLGYEIEGTKGAEVVVEFSTLKSYDSLYTIPKNTQITTSGENKIPYLTTEEIVMYPGVIKTEVLCVQGTIIEEPYYGTGLSSLDGSINSEDQYTILDELGIDLDSIKIVDEYGNKWKKVKTVFFSNSNERVFSVKLLHDGKVKIQFGNDLRGFSPTTLDILNITYVSSLGRNGKVGANKLNIISRQSNFVTENGTSVTDLKVINHKNSTGGVNPEDSEFIRLLAPAIIKSQDRAVTLSDFEALTMKVPGVKDVKAYDINNSPVDTLYYEVKLLVVPEIDSDIGILHKNINDYLKSKMLPPTILSIISPIYKSIDINCTVVINNNYTEETVDYRIREQLNLYFDNLSTSLGISINHNTLISIISKVEGVLYVENITPNSTIELDPLEIPLLGDLELVINRREG